MVFIAIYLLSILICGISVLSFCEIRKGNQWPIHKLLAFAYVIGSGVSAFVLFWMALAGIPPTALWIIYLFVFSIFLFALSPARRILSSIALACKISGQKQLKNQDIMMSNTDLIGRSTILLAIFALLLSFSIVFMNSLFMPLWDIDSFALWGLKSKAIYFTSLDKGAYFHRIGYGFSHLEYPLLAPFLNAGIYLCLGGCPQNWGKLLYIPLFLSLVVVLCSAAARNMDKILSFGFAALLFSSPAILQWSAAGTADIYVVAFYAAMLFFSIGYIENRDKSNLSLSILCGAFLVFSKNEGLPIAVINILCVLCAATIMKFDIRDKIRIIAYASLGAFILIPWFMWSSDIPRIHENYPEHIGKILDPKNLSRIPDITFQFFSQGKNCFRWGLFWLIFPVSLIFARKSAKFLVPLVCLFANFALYFLIFVISPWDVSYLSAAALERLLTHLSVPAFYVMVSSLGPLSENSRRN